MIKQSVIEKITGTKKLKLFFCGIGGIGMSGLALLAKNCGYIVVGSNMEENANTEKLQKNNVKVYIGHDAKNLYYQDGLVDIFIYSSAIQIDKNCEAIEAKKNNIPILHRGEMLAILMRHYYSIVVAGSHGKTTTTGLIWHMLNELDKRPNILIGGVLNCCNLNCVVNQGKYFVVESDESDGSFSLLETDVGVITNIDPEHMEFYKTKDNLERYFLNFAKNSLNKKGVVICIDDEIGKNVLKTLKREATENEKEKILTYSLEDRDADFFATNIRYNINGLLFDVHDKRNKRTLYDVFLSNLYGECNVFNVLAAMGVAELLGFSAELENKNVFKNFQGIQKRFTVLGKIYKNVLVVDDYAHNPQKIASAIHSAKHYALTHGLEEKITVVFEPHRYTRVRDGMELFVDALKNVANVITLPIYSASEQRIDGIDDDFVFNKVKKSNANTYRCNADIDEIYDLCKRIIDEKHTNLIVFMGAGKSSKLAHSLFEKYGLAD